MNLTLIKETKCPDCDERIVAESCRHYHCNGEGFEEREFKCGCIIEYVPNFGQTRIKKKCPYNSEVVATAKKQQDFKDKLLKMIEDADIDELTKNNLKRDIRYS